MLIIFDDKQINNNIIPLVQYNIFRQQYITTHDKQKTYLPIIPIPILDGEIINIQQRDSLLRFSRHEIQTHTNSQGSKKITGGDRTATTTTLPFVPPPPPWYAPDWRTARLAIARRQRVCRSESTDSITSQYTQIYNTDLST